MAATSTDDAPVLFATCLPQCLAILDHNQERRHARQTNERCGDEAVLIPHVRDPRRDPASQLVKVS